MATALRDVHIYFSREEMEDLERMAAIQNAPVRSVIRAMTRHFILEFRAGRQVQANLGAVIWPRGSSAEE